jgi:creatinine amidohydrolase/Fe(II)-dependent formamide hydrolase-like protein
MIEWNPEERDMDCKNALKPGPTEISMTQALQEERARRLDSAMYTPHEQQVPIERYFVLHPDLVAMDRAWDPQPSNRWANVATR